MQDAALANVTLPPGYQALCGVNNPNANPPLQCWPNTGYDVWVDTVEAVAQQECDVFFPIGVPIANPNWIITNTSCFYKSSQLGNVFDVKVHVTFNQCDTGWRGNVCNPVESDVDFNTFLRYNPPAYFLKPDVPSKSQPLACCENKVAHPIDPVDGATIDVMDDLASGVPFHRFYSSQDKANKALSVAWRHSYDRTVAQKYSSLAIQLYVASASTSSSYADPASACMSGFAELQSKVQTWSGATALYVDGNCQLTKGGLSAGSVPIYYTRQTLPLASTPVAYDVTRDDGQVVRFTVQGGVITAPPGTSMQLAQTGSGFALTDGNDNFEQYDATGKLLSVISRAGVVQTMSYDGFGRLGGVTDNFGHQLVLSYDGQGRLITVTIQ